MSQNLSYQKVGTVFQKLPKGADLHSHFSSAVSYEDILFEVQESHIYEEVYFSKQKMELQLIDKKMIKNNPEKFSNNDYFAKFYRNERYIKELVCKTVKAKIEEKKYQENLKNGKGVKKNSEDDDDNDDDEEEQQINQQEEKEEGNDETKTQKFDPESAFIEYNALGNIFYNVIKSDIFYKNYCELIFENMKENNIYYQELRLKIDFKDRKFIVPAQKLLEKLMELNEIYFTKGYQIRIIAQFGRWANNLEQQVKEFLNFIQDRKKFRRIFIGVDFTGQEVNELNKEIMQSEEIIKLMKNLDLQFYNHAGEMIVPEEHLLVFGWQYNHNLQNVLYLLETHQTKYSDLYTKKIRIGHGIVFLQWMDYLKSNPDKENDENYAKYKKLSENVCFEVCPFSNLHFYGGQLSKKIYEEFQNQICICTDDQNKMDRTISDAFFYLSVNIGLSFETLKQYARNSIIFSAMEEQIQQVALKKLETDLEEWEDEYNGEVIISQAQKEHIEFSMEVPWWESQVFKKLKI